MRNWIINTTRSTLQLGHVNLNIGHLNLDIDHLNLNIGHFNLNIGHLNLNNSVKYKPLNVIATSKLKQSYQGIYTMYVDCLQEERKLLQIFTNNSQASQAETQEYFMTINSQTSRGNILNASPILSKRNFKHVSILLLSVTVNILVTCNPSYLS